MANRLAGRLISLEQRIAPKRGPMMCTLVTDGMSEAERQAARAETIAKFPDWATRDHMFIVLCGPAPDPHRHALKATSLEVDHGLA